MAAPITKLLFLYLLGIASWSRCATANKVTVTGFSAEVPDGNEVLESWGGDVSNNLINTVINVKKDCQSVVQVEIKVFKDGVVVNNIGKSLKDPVKELLELNVCASIDGPEPEESYSLAQGEQSAKDCDMSQWFSDMEPGEYETKAEFSVDGNTIANVNVQVKVESE